MRLLVTLLVGLALPASAQCDARKWRALLGTRSAYPVTAKSTDEALAHPAFFDRFASFINSRFNPEPGRNHAADASWYVVRHVLANDLPWRDVFVGRFNVPNKDYPTVQADPNGLGYFTSEGWLLRYAGNEPDGWLLVAANRILQNTIGSERVAAANNSEADIPNDAQGRQAAACAGCHYLGPYALDHVARVLPRKQVTNGRTTFLPPPGTPQPVLNRSVSTTRELVETLVASDAFNFWTCRLAFEFVYGRPEYACEAALFDRCVDAFVATGKVQAAVKVLVDDPALCGGP